MRGHGAADETQFQSAATGLRRMRIAHPRRFPKFGAVAPFSNGQSTDRFLSKWSYFAAYLGFFVHSGTLFEGGTGVAKRMLS